LAPRRRLGTTFFKIWGSACSSLAHHRWQRRTDRAEGETWWRDLAPDPSSIFATSIAKFSSLIVFR
jgi:hypothetical protein